MGIQKAPKARKTRGTVAKTALATLLVIQGAVSGCQWEADRQRGESSLRQLLPSPTATPDHEGLPTRTPAPSSPPPGERSAEVVPGAPIRPNWLRLALVIGGTEVAALDRLPGGISEGRYPVLVTVAGDRISDCRSLGLTPDLYGEAVCGAVAELGVVDVPEGTIEAVAVLKEVAP